MAIYIKKIEVWNDSQTMWDLFQTSELMQKTCTFYVSRTLHSHVGSGLHAHAVWLRVQTNSCVHLLRVSLV